MPVKQLHTTNGGGVGRDGLQARTGPGTVPGSFHSVMQVSQFVWEGVPLKAAKGR